MGGGGRGGGGTTTTTTQASFPPEFRPLASAAVEQIRQLQQVVPLAPFGGAQEVPIAGLAPFTLAGFDLTTLLPRLPAVEQAAAPLALTAGPLAQQAASLSTVTPAAQAALGLLGTQLGAPATFTPLPGVTLNLPAPFSPPPSVFPGLTEDQLAALRAQLPGAVVPVTALPPLMPGTPTPAVQTQLDAFAQQLQQLAALQAQTASALRTAAAPPPPAFGEAMFVSGP